MAIFTKKQKPRKKRDYIAMLTVYGIGHMSKREVRNMTKWLKRLVGELELDPKMFSHKRFIARYMKG